MGPRRALCDGLGATTEDVLHKRTAPVRHAALASTLYASTGLVSAGTAFARSAVHEVVGMVGANRNSPDVRRRRGRGDGAVVQRRVVSRRAAPRASACRRRAALGRRRRRRRRLWRHREADASRLASPRGHAGYRPQRQGAAGDDRRSDLGLALALAAFRRIVRAAGSNVCTAGAAAGGRADGSCDRRGCSSLGQSTQGKPVRLTRCD